MLYILSATYEVKLNALTLKLYNDETEQLEEWSDSEYKAYFLSKNRVENLNGIYKQELIEKYDALHDKYIELWKVQMDNPALIKQSESLENVYENQIKFFLSYIYDNNIRMGMPYERKGSNIIFKEDTTVSKRIEEIINKFNLNDDESEIYKIWAELMEYPAPNFKRAALDIEVYNMPNVRIALPSQALSPVTAVCFAPNKGEKIALVLIREGMKFEKLPLNIDRIIFFTSEMEMLMETFKLINEYPMILTFNGDEFDLPYLYFRAIRLGINVSKIPIDIRNNVAMLNNSIHIDLHKFFFIKAMKVYAFGNKYKDVGLDEVSQALIGKGKIKSNKSFNDLSYYELTQYCMNDAELTLELSTYDDNVVINLILMVQRISRLPIENSSRKNVGAWIRNFMTYEHRRKNYLIPSPNSIKGMKGGTASIALIKGKKYKGAIVFEPKSGIHFTVLVLDFASLYPSVIKLYNIGYATVNCPHKECETNTIGELKHWICKKNISMESQLIGSLRDLRVGVYKKKAKDKSLPKPVMNWYKVAEQSIKVIMNASYGVFGDELFDYYCPPSAEEIAAIARYITSSTAKKAQELGLNVIYGDTDSIFIKNPDIDKLNELIAWTKNEFGIDFEIDKRYKYACLSERKKNYFGVKEDEILKDGTIIKGDVDIKGLTGKKKHTPKIIKKTFDEIKTILSNVNTKEEMEPAKSKIVNLIKELTSLIKKKKWININDIAFNVTMSKSTDAYKTNIPQHVKAAKMLEQEGIPITANSNISYIKITRKETITSEKTGKKRIVMVSDVKPVELATKEEVDTDKYTEFIKSTFSQILEPLDIDFDEKILGITKLESFNIE
jgi:DNA polymerase, archaea type